MTTKNSQNNKIFHPLLFGIYPVLFMMSVNLGEFPFQESWRSVFVAFLSSVILWFFLNSILKDKQKSALITTVLLIVFFSYGHVYNYLGQEEIFAGTLKRHRYLIPFYFLVVSVNTWWIIKRGRNLDQVSQAFNIMGMVLLILPLYQIIFFEIRSFSQKAIDRERASSTANAYSLQNTENYPDIYYIILDAYARDDVLLELYDYDNSKFLDELNSRGFYVAKCSTSNYGKTFLSLASSLNMTYLDELGGDSLRTKSTGEPDLVKLRALNQHNEVRKSLEMRGYKTVAFQSGAQWTGWDDADYYYSDFKDKNGSIIDAIQQPFPNEFESLLVETSVAQLFIDTLSTTDVYLGFGINEGQGILNANSRERIKYNRVNYILDTLEEIPLSVESPKFVFAHIISPHGPYVFTAHGEFIPNQKDINPGYLDQITFLNQRILTIVDKIIQESKVPPVIIIQGDHGSPGTEHTPLRLPILNVYYLSNEGNILLYPSITPVNTFRVVFDHYFETDYGLLDDISRNSAEDNLFNFTVIPNSCERE